MTPLKTHYIIFISALLTLAGCEKVAREKPQPEVVVTTVTTKPYQAYKTFVGKLTASSDVEIEARVKAKIVAVNFKEGKQVNEGDSLFVLDEKELKAQRRQVKAEVSKAESALNSANKNYQRGLELKPDGYISASELDALEDKVAESNALLESAKAKLETANVNLAYAQINAPITGRIDRAKFSVGDIVSPEVGSLTSIVSVNSMEVPFQVGEKEYWKMVRKFQNAVPDSVFKPIVEIAFSKTDIYEHQGVISFVSNRVNPETGSMEVRATVPNPNRILKPGQHVTVYIKSPEPTDTVMIPQTAVQSDQQGDYVLVVDSNNIVSRKNIATGERIDVDVIVEKGVEVGEVIIIRGVQKVRPDQQVKTISAEDKDANITPTVTTKA